MTSSNELICRRSGGDDGSSRGNSESQSESDSMRWRRYIIWFLRRFVTFLFSHVGLTSLVVGYMILGGLIFMKLEGENEREKINILASQRKNLAEKLWALSQRLKADGEFFNWEEEAHELLEWHQMEVYNATRGGWEGEFGEVKWSFPGALLYSVTVITTIGYGHLTPQTDTGRIVTIIYAMIGIPMTLLCLSNLGQFLGGFFAVLYRLCISNVLRLLAGVFLPRTPAFSKKLGRELARKSIRASREAKKQQQLQDGDDMDDDISDEDIYLEFKNDTTEISMSATETTEARESSVVIVDENNIRKISLSIEGETKGVRFDNDNSDSVRRSSDVDKTDASDTFYDATDSKVLEDTDTSISNLDNNFINLKKKKRRVAIRRPKPDKHRKFVAASKRLASIPILLAIALIIAYILGGAVLFDAWEDGWTFCIGVYFCFTTLTTIGFGDYVPGIGTGSNHQKSILCVLYLLVGLALLSMCFHLIQTEVMTKARRLAIRCGMHAGNADDSDDCLGDEEKKSKSCDDDDDWQSSNDIIYE